MRRTISFSKSARDVTTVMSGRPPSTNHPAPTNAPGSPITTALRLAGHWCCIPYTTSRQDVEVTMTPEQIEALGPTFAEYLRQFLFCCEYTQTFDLLNIYCRGLLSDLPRKSAEPIALASGTAVRTLQEFLKDHA